MLRKTDYRFTPVGTGVLRKQISDLHQWGQVVYRNRLWVYTSGNRVFREKQITGLHHQEHGCREKQITGLHQWGQVC